MTKFSWFSFKKDVPSYTAKGIEITTRKNRIRIGVIINTKPHPLYKISTHLIRTWKLHIETRRRHKTTT